MKKLLLLIIISSAINAEADNITIKGKNKSYAGVQLIVKAYSDPFTRIEETLSQTKVQPDGSFSLQFEVSETRLVFIPLGIYKGFLFIEPNKKYEIKFPPKKDKTSVDKLNPYFKQEELMLGIVGAETTELNYSIRKFDDQLNSFINKNFNSIYRRGDLSVGLEYAKKLDKQYQNVSNPFLKDYIEYSLGFIEFLSYPNLFTKLENKYFKKREILYNNPAYISLYKKLYNDFLLGYLNRKEDDAINKALKSKDSYNKIIKIFSKYRAYADEKFRNILLLTSLFDSFNQKTIPFKKILSLTQQIEKTLESEKNKIIAKNIISRLTNMQKGYPAPDFSIKNKDKSYKLSDFRGKYLYLNFCNTQNYACQKDFEELQKLHKLFGEHIAFLSIATDWDMEKFQEYIKSQSYSWDIIPVEEQSQIIEKYQIKAYPTYILIDDKGNIINPTAPGPREYIENTFKEIIRNRQRANYKESNLENTTDSK